MTLSDRLIPITLLVAMLGSSSCSQKNVKPEEESSSQGAEMQTLANESRNSDIGNALGLKTIHFEFDSNLLSEAEKRLLDGNVQVLRDNLSVRVQLEGHCDSRGGIQYNIALGERRAQTVQHYLTDQGIPEARVEIVSFGKERLLDATDTEAAHAKNRRGNFVVLPEKR